MRCAFPGGCVRLNLRNFRNNYKILSGLWRESNPKPLRQGGRKNFFQQDFSDLCLWKLQIGLHNWGKSTFWRNVYVWAFTPIFSMVCKTRLSVGVLAYISNLCQGSDIFFFYFFWPGSLWFKIVEIKPTIMEDLWSKWHLWLSEFTWDLSF